MENPLLLFSIKPRFAAYIYEGTKQVELRRARPKRLKAGSIVLLYESSPTSLVTGYFTVRNVVEASICDIWDASSALAALSEEEFRQYYRGRPYGVAIFVKDVVQLTQPVSLDEMGPIPGAIAPPQSYRYLRLHDLPRSNALGRLAVAQPSCGEPNFTKACSRQKANGSQ
jgi:predicted transcriptional regulator